MHCMRRRVPMHVADIHTILLNIHMQLNKDLHIEDINHSYYAYVLSCMWMPALKEAIHA